MLRASGHHLIKDNNPMALVNPVVIGILLRIRIVLVIIDGEVNLR